MTVQEIQEIQTKYTRIVKQDSKYLACLQIDHQGFCVCPGTTKVRAKWFCKMLAIALSRFLEENAGQRGETGI